MSDESAKADSDSYIVRMERREKEHSERDERRTKAIEHQTALLAVDVERNAQHRAEWEAAEARTVACRAELKALDLERHAEYLARVAAERAEWREVVAVEKEQLDRLIAQNDKIIELLERIAAK